MFSSLKRLIIGSPFENVIRYFVNKPKKPKFEHTAQYWDDRYRTNGNSGAGSYGRLADFKSEVLNKFVILNNVKSVIEFGCGDGNQLALAEYPKYIGVDISDHSILLCKKRFHQDESKIFIASKNYNSEKAELALSLDVIYHLVEEDTFAEYMHCLFNSSERFVIIYSCDCSDGSLDSSHVKTRKFTGWVEANILDFRLMEKVTNRYPYNKESPDDTSISDFYFYERLPNA